MSNKTETRASLISTALENAYKEDGIIVSSGTLSNRTDIVMAALPYEDGSQAHCSIFVDKRTGFVQLGLSGVISDITVDYWNDAAAFCNGANVNDAKLKFVFCLETQSIDILATIPAEVPDSCVGELAVSLYEEMLGEADLIRANMSFDDEDEDYEDEDEDEDDYEDDDDEGEEDYFDEDDN